MKDLELPLVLKEAEIEARECSFTVPTDRSDVTRTIRRVLHSVTKGADKFFAHFERAATIPKWPRESEDHDTTEYLC